MSITAIVSLACAGCEQRLDHAENEEAVDVRLLDPESVPKFVAPLVVPPAMPPSASDASVNYQLALRQFRQQILPSGFPATTVWGYGSIDAPGTVVEGGSFHAPSFTIEATAGEPVTIKWMNDLMDERGGFLPHLVPVDQTLDWANPPQQCANHVRTTDCAGSAPTPYKGPVPMVVHVHGAHVDGASDGFAEGWYLPAASNLPERFATRGIHFSSSPALLTSRARRPSAIRMIRRRRHSGTTIILSA